MCCPLLVNHPAPSGMKTLDSVTPLEVSSDTSSPSPARSIGALPSDIILLLFQAFDDLPPSSLTSLARCSWEMHDRFAPVLYRRIVLDKASMKSVFSGLPITSSHDKLSAMQQKAKERKMSLLGQTRELTIHDLPALDHLSRVVIASHPGTGPEKSLRADPCNLTSTKPSLFASITSLSLSGKAVLGLADLYNASSWGSSPTNLPYNPILRALRHLQPKDVTLAYPASSYPPMGVSMHMHSCIEDVVGYLTSAWELDTLRWEGLARPMVGPVPKARQLLYGFTSCQYPSQSETLKGCPKHYDHVSLTCHTYLDHVISNAPVLGSAEQGEKEAWNLRMSGLGCMFSLDWEKVVDEVWGRMGRLEEDDWAKIERWRNARVTLTA